MKKEWLAAVLLILLLAAALINIWYLDGMMAGLRETVERSRELAVSGDFDRASELVNEAAAQWASADAYTHIVIRHSEIDSLSDCFYDLLGYLRSSDADSAEGGYDKLLYHISSIASMEYVTLGSIF